MQNMSDPTKVEDIHKLEAAFRLWVTHAPKLEVVDLIAQGNKMVHNVVSNQFCNSH
jgi:hypothetical protein